ncbi:hypothetical protein OIU84_027327 [Salix udensis]|uniref:Uncharacterized protein n=1 Tax=Salix udensis TaxID=889485 RepID=A0AAD6KF53_9ROSI|nr:hypothetical protein OIU84_027327 [Salix udensis]
MCGSKQELSMDMLVSLLRSCRNVLPAMRSNPIVENPPTEDPNESNQQISNLKDHLKGTFFKDPSDTILEACGFRWGKPIPSAASWTRRKQFLQRGMTNVAGRSLNELCEYSLISPIAICLRSTTLVISFEAKVYFTYREDVGWRIGRKPKNSC